MVVGERRSKYILCDMNDFAHSWERIDGHTLAWKESMLFQPFFCYQKINVTNYLFGFVRQSLKCTADQEVSAWPVHFMMQWIVGFIETNQSRRMTVQNFDHFNYIKKLYHRFRFQVHLKLDIIHTFLLILDSL